MADQVVADNEMTMDDEEEVNERAKPREKAPNSRFYAVLLPRHRSPSKSRHRE